jgi:hypothetical protein
MHALSNLLKDLSVAHVLVTSMFDDLKPSTELTVYHGTDASQTIEFLQRGIDGSIVHYRTHNQGRERGIYITPDKRTALDFGHVVLEFQVKAKYLYPTARWGLGSQHKDPGALKFAKEQYPNSFRPIVSYQLNEKHEPQAMFLGYVEPTEIKVHYLTPGGSYSAIRELTDDEVDLMFKIKREAWDINLSGEEMLNNISKEHDITKSELVEIYKSFDLAQTLDAMRMPRKLQLRLLQTLRRM